MNLGQMQFYSQALERHVSFSFSLPSPDDAGPGPYPALLQLHGRTDDHTAWLTRSKLAVYLDKRPLIAIMPDGGLSFWANRGPRERYEDFIMRDLLPACAAFFPIRPGRWAIGGLSMGGFGALRLGLKYPDRFASIYGHSSAIFTRADLQQRAPELLATGDEATDPFALAEKALNAPNRPRLSFDCGLQDMAADGLLLPRNRAFHEHLERLGFPHHYAEFLGGHTWEYWDEHVREALAQHLEVFAAAATPVGATP